MRFLVYGHRQGGRAEVEAPGFREALARFREEAGQRPVALSAWCTDPRHLHYPDGQWHSADDLLEEEGHGEH